MLPNLKKLRKEFGISQQRLADAIGISQPSINKYENHNIEPEIEILKRLADYFNTSIDYIVGYTEIRRRIELTEACYLNLRESELIRRFQNLNESEKACIENVVDTLLKNRS